VEFRTLVILILIADAQQFFLAPVLQVTQPLADVLLSTDDRLIELGRRIGNQIARRSVYLSCANAGEDSKQQSNRTLETFLKIKVAFCKSKKSLGVPMDTRAKPRLLRSI
jgi:hypothetical protein